MNKDISRLSFRAMSLYFWIALVGLVFIGKLFYLQVIRHDHYAALATDEQQSKFIVPASRGSIEAFDGQTPVPLVLNENLPTVFADPNGITNVEATATALSNILKIPRRKIEPKLSTDTRYEVIAKRVSHNRALKVKKAELAGIGLTDTYYRVYPQRGLAAHVLGFVNDEGKGQYGIEEHLDDQLKGKNGRLNAVTDVYGIPLTATEQSVSKPAVDGDDLVLTIDVNIQKTAEAAIKKVAKQTKAKSASAIVLDPHTGAIKAMASYPTFAPAKFGQAKEF